MCTLVGTPRTVDRDRFGRAVPGAAARVSDGGTDGTYFNANGIPRS
jgi:hypothetical protein